MYGKQPQLPIDVTLGLTPKFVGTPTSIKYIQKLKECIRWAHKKANLFQQKEVQHHKQNCDKHNKTVALRAGGMVLVHITTFKGPYKIQNRWENREYVVELQSYPNLPVYVVCPMDGERCSQTLHRNYLLSINNNLEQAGNENYVEGVEPTPLPQAHNELLANGPTKSQPESLHNSLQKTVQTSQLGQPPQTRQMIGSRLARTSLLH